MSASLTIAVLSTIAAVIRVVGQALGLRTRPTARQLAERAAHDARAASAQGDTTAVNTAIERERIKRHLLVFIAIGLLFCSGCIPLPVPVVSGSGGSGWSGWRIGLSWGAPPPVISIPEESGSGGSSCGPTSCSEGGGR